MYFKVFFELQNYFQCLPIYRFGKIKTNIKKSSVKLAETKIYIRFLGWFVVVSILPTWTFLTLVYTFFPDQDLLKTAIIERTFLFAILVDMAMLLALSLVATARLSKYVAKPAQNSIEELAKVTKALLKSVANLSDISDQNSKIAQFLLDSSKKQKEGLDFGEIAVVGMLESLDKIVNKTNAAVIDAKSIDNLASDGKEKSTLAIESLSTIKHLVTENQKLGHALDVYTDKVQEVSGRMQALSETAKFLSLNVSIEASKKSFADEFSELVSQIRELNISTEQAALGINELASEMHHQIKQSRESSVFESQEADKSIGIIDQTVEFLAKIADRVINISGSIKSISKETSANYQDADNISSMIKDLHEKSKSLFDKTDEISHIINQQAILTRSLSDSAESLDRVNKNLNKLI